MNNQGHLQKFSVSTVKSSWILNFTVCPIDEFSRRWILPGFEEPGQGSVYARGHCVFGSPEEEVLSVSYIQVSRVLLHVYVTELWLGHTKPICGERGVGDKFVWSQSLVETHRLGCYEAGLTSQPVVVNEVASVLDPLFDLVFGLVKNGIHAVGNFMRILFRDTKHRLSVVWWDCKRYGDESKEGQERDFHPR